MQSPKNYKKMTDIKDTTAAELLAEWKNLQIFFSDDMRLCSDLEKWKLMQPEVLDKATTIAARLDEMCEGMDIEHGGNFTEVRTYMVNPYDNVVDGELVSKDLSEAEIKKIETEQLIEMIALLQWLLIKAQ
jgi:hypothetical protein